MLLAFSDLAEAIENCPRGCGHMGPPADPECALDDADRTGRHARVAAARRLLDSAERADVLNYPSSHAVERNVMEANVQRPDNDSWDLATGVGATATMVAAGRARATRSDNPVIDDPYAEPLVRAVGIDFFTRWATGELSTADVDVPGAPGACS